MITAKNETATIEALKELISKHSAVPKGSISGDSLLAEDLKIVGDDAAELFDEICTSFGTDFSEMNFSEYFPDESTADMHYFFARNGLAKKRQGFISMLYRMESYFWGIFASRKSYKPLSVQHLLTAIRNGKWTEFNHTR